MKLDDLVEKYIKLRDRRAHRKAEFEAADGSDKLLQEKIEGLLMIKFEESGVESVKTSAGTAYTSTRSSATVGDKDTYFGWILEDPEERIGFLESRVSKTALEQYKSVTAELPPGVNWSETRTVNVRRS